MPLLEEKTMVQQRIEAFDAKHGQSIDVPGWILFEDGARREQNPLGLLDSPPSDPHELAKRILHYHETRLRYAVEEFDQLKSSLLIYARTAAQDQYGPPPPPASEVARLEQLKATVEAVRRDVENAEQAFTDTIPPEVIARRKQAEANRQANQSCLAKIESITV